MGPFQIRVLSVSHSMGLVRIIISYSFIWVQLIIHSLMSKLVLLTSVVKGIPYLAEQQYSCLNSYCLAFGPIILTALSTNVDAGYDAVSNRCSCLVEIVQLTSIENGCTHDLIQLKGWLRDKNRSVRTEVITEVMNILLIACKCNRQFYLTFVTTHAVMRSYSRKKMSFVPVFIYLKNLNS